MRRMIFSAFLALPVMGVALAQPAAGPENGKLQLHFMDVGQGDGAILISPLGETVLFDDGVRSFCDLPISYLQQLGVKTIDYHITSHYHDDHIGCAAPVLGQFPLQKQAFDRGGTYKSSTYDAYVAAVGNKRKTAVKGTAITLDSASPNPVQIRFVALNGAGVTTTNENDLSLVAMVKFGQFDAELGGDLSGFKTSSYEDIETKVIPDVQQVEVYKVHHHGSAHSSNSDWLAKIKPMIGVISASNTIGRNYDHPTTECMERLHNAGIKKTYWTERGSGATPELGLDVVGGNIVVETGPGDTTFTVTYSGNQVDTYPFWGAAMPVNPANAPVANAYAWSKRSTVYHHASCAYVRSISPSNLETGSTPPADRTLHTGCPK